MLKEAYVLYVHSTIYNAQKIQKWSNKNINTGLSSNPLLFWGKSFNLGLWVSRQPIIPLHIICTFLKLFWRSTRILLLVIDLRTCRSAANRPETHHLFAMLAKPHLIQTFQMRRSKDLIKRIQFKLHARILVDYYLVM